MAHLAEYENPSFTQINCAIEELHSERQPDEPRGKLLGVIRNALDSAFRHDTVESILETLAKLSSSPDTCVNEWAKETLEILHMRSPTSLKVALAAIRRGKNMSLRDALQMEMGIVTAYCVSLVYSSKIIDRCVNILQNGASPDFRTGISAVLIDRVKGRPMWTPEKIDDVSPEILDRFFSNDSPYRSQMPPLSFPDTFAEHVGPMAFVLPSESKIVEMIKSLCKDGPVSLSGLLSDMEHLIKEKAGTKDKVLDVVYRTCQVVDDQGIARVAWKEV